MDGLNNEEIIIELDSRYNCDGSCDEDCHHSDHDCDVIIAGYF